MTYNEMIKELRDYTSEKGFTFRTGKNTVVRHGDFKEICRFSTVDNAYENMLSGYLEDMMIKNGK